MGEDLFGKRCWNFRKIQTDVFTYSLMPGTQTWLFWNFRYALSISGIFKVIAHNIQYFQKNCGHVTLAAKGLYGDLPDGWGRG